jgi:hypothetical protein
MPSRVVDMTTDTILYLEIPWRDRANTHTEADLMAEVIAERIEGADWIDHREFGPGRITDLEHNLERIFEV